MEREIKGRVRDRGTERRERGRGMEMEIDPTGICADRRGLNLLFASTSAGANRSYYGSSYTSINIYSRFSLSPYGYYTLAV